MSRYLQKNKLFFEFAKSLRTLSTCIRRQEAAIIYTLDCSRIVSIGYNGAPSGVSNDKCLESIGDSKKQYLPCKCVDADMNALVKLGDHPVHSLIMYTTLCPSVQAAGLIANCRSIQGVIFGSKMKVMDPTTMNRMDGETILSECGVPSILEQDLNLTIPDPQLEVWRGLWPPR